MSQWKINTFGLVVLGSLIFLMLLIVYLPDVDLPDAAFHSGTAPVVLNAHATNAPAAIDAVLLWHAPESDQASSDQPQSRMYPAHMRPNFRPILLRSIRC